MRTWAITGAIVLLFAAGCHAIGDVSDVTYAPDNTGGGGASASGSSGAGATGSSSSGGDECDLPNCPVGSPCEPAVCDGSACGFLKKPQHAPCEVMDGISGYCTVRGQCVECTQDAQCDPDLECIDNICDDPGCIEQDDCDPGEFCNEYESCVPKKDVGDPCLEDYECLSDNCDGDASMCARNNSGNG